MVNVKTDELMDWLKDYGTLDLSPEEVVAVEKVIFLMRLKEGIPQDEGFLFVMDPETNDLTDLKVYFRKK